MQNSSSQAPAAGQLVASFRYGKAFLIFMTIFGIVLLGLAGAVLYLSTIVPPEPGPVSMTTQRGMTLNFSSQAALFYATSGFLVVAGLFMIGGSAWQRRYRQSSYELFEHGIATTTKGETSYLAYTDIEDVYLFSSGQTVMTGMVTNLAFRRNASEPFHRVIEALKGFQDFQQLFRELYLNARQQPVLDTLQAGGSVKFNYISSTQVWRKRISGNFLNIETLPIVVSKDQLLIQGSHVPLSALRSIDQSAWSEKVVIRDASGKAVLSTIATGILSHDLFLNTLSLMLEAPAAEHPQAAPAQAL